MTINEFMASAIAGMLEETASIKEEKRLRRIFLCGKPHFYTGIDGKKHSVCLFCKDAECYPCNVRRGFDEMNRLDRALLECEVVYALFEVQARNWTKLIAQFKDHNITKNMYRRLPQDDGKLVVFFVGSGSLARTLKAKSLYSSSESDDRNWYDLSRKRPGKRTSGNLGKELLKPGDENKESVKITAARGEKVKFEDEQTATQAADKAAASYEAVDKATLEERMEAWALGYQATLQKLGYDTSIIRVYRKLDLSSLGEANNTNVTNDIKSSSDLSESVKLAQEHLWPRELVEI